MEKGKILGVDYGKKRVGLATTDPDRIVVFPRETVKNDGYLIPDIVKLCAEESILKVVFGVPLKFDGGDTGQSLEIKEFAKKFAAETGLEVDFQDEAYTTFEAEQIIKGRSDLSDHTFAAMKILEHYLKKSEK